MENTYYGELSVIGMPGCEKFVEEVDSYLHAAARPILSLPNARDSETARGKPFFTSRCAVTMCISSQICTITA